VGGSLKEVGVPFPSGIGVAGRGDTIQSASKIDGSLVKDFFGLNLNR
jgi:hypothetical protein